MAQWGAFHLTKAGTSLLADAHNAKTLRLSRIVLGSGELAAGQDTYTMTSLVKQEQEFYIRDIKNNGDGTFTITTRVTNNGLAAGYRMRECGIYAETYSYDENGDQVTTQTLFGTAQATDADFMPPPTAATMVDSEMRITIVISSDANVTCTIDYDAYATIKYSDEQDDSLYEKVKALLKKTINGLDLLPVGTILAYSGDLSKIPTGWHLCDGTDGTPNLVGRFLEGVTSGAGTLKAAGLPNIWGQFGQEGYLDTYAGNGSYNGLKNAFYIDGVATSKTSAAGGGTDNLYKFDASRSNPIYGASKTVQPASYTVYYIIKQKNVTIDLDDDETKGSDNA